jgi:hypothetical protein
MAPSKAWSFYGELKETDGRPSHPELYLNWLNNLNWLRRHYSHRNLHALGRGLIALLPPCWQQHRLAYKTEAGFAALASHDRRSQITCTIVSRPATNPAPLF